MHHPQQGRAVSRKNISHRLVISHSCNFDQIISDFVPLLKAFVRQYRIRILYFRIVASLQMKNGREMRPGGFGLMVRSDKYKKPARPAARPPGDPGRDRAKWKCKGWRCLSGKMPVKCWKTGAKTRMSFSHGYVIWIKYFPNNWIISKNWIQFYDKKIVVNYYFLKQE